MISKDTLLDTLAKFRLLQKLVDDDQQRNYIRYIESVNNGVKFFDGNGNVICQISLAGDGTAGIADDDNIATDNEVNEMFDEIFGGT